MQPGTGCIWGTFCRANGAPSLRDDISLPVVALQETRSMLPLLSPVTTSNVPNGGDRIYARSTTLNLCPVHHFKGPLMQQFRIRPHEMVATLWRNRSLIGAAVKREIFGRYRGSILGILWSFFNPLFMLVIYTFVFGTVLKARWGSHEESHAQFGLALFAGLITFNFFAESVNRSTTLIVSKTNYVKKVVFPIEILPYVIIGSSIFHLVISLSIWVAGYTILYGIPYLTIFYYPLVLFPLVIFTLGLSWFLSSLGVFLRDISQFIGIITTALMFLSPVFYPASALPEDYRFLLYLNPLTPAIEYSRDVLYWVNQPNFIALSLYFVAASVFAWLGFAWFQKTRKGFADVI
jgi:lipopolysaccharide transport system permease protein